MQKRKPNFWVSRKGFDTETPEAWAKRECAYYREQGATWFQLDRDPVETDTYVLSGWYIRPENDNQLSFEDYYGRAEA